jgi:hypothetical protein
MTSGGGNKIFSEVVKKPGKRQKIQNNRQTKERFSYPEHIKIQLKENINRTEIKVGIKDVKTIRDMGLLIETGSLEEVNTLSTEITRN